MWQRCKKPKHGMKNIIGLNKETGFRLFLVNPIFLLSYFLFQKQSERKRRKKSEKLKNKNTEQKIRPRKLVRICFVWCEGRDLNPNGISTTSPSNLRVCHSTTPAEKQWHYSRPNCVCQMVYKKIFNSLKQTIAN